MLHFIGSIFSFAEKICFQQKNRSTKSRERSGSPKNCSVFALGETETNKKPKQEFILVWVLLVFSILYLH